jgi:hypothetical protein
MPLRFRQLAVEPIEYQRNPSDVPVGRIVIHVDHSLRKALIPHDGEHGLRLFYNPCDRPVRETGEYILVTECAD